MRALFITVACLAIFAFVAGGQEDYTRKRAAERAAAAPTNFCSVALCD